MFCGVLRFVVGRSHVMGAMRKAGTGWAVVLESAERRWYNSWRLLGMVLHCNIIR